MLYKDWAPTQFDTKGLGADNRQNWHVVPVMQTRDSGPLEQSNFCIAQEWLDDYGAQYEIHRFNHWANGWFEIILASPSAIYMVKSIRGVLEDYSILDEMDYSRREHEEMANYWESMGLAGRIECCRENQESIFAARHDNWPESCDEYLRSE